MRPLEGRIERFALGAALLLVLIAAALAPAARALSPQVAADAAWCRTPLRVLLSGGVVIEAPDMLTRDLRDPWGAPWREREARVEDAGVTMHFGEAYSSGPDGVDDGGAGDDVILTSSRVLRAIYQLHLAGVRPAGWPAQRPSPPALLVALGDQAAGVGAVVLMWLLLVGRLTRRWRALPRVTALALLPALLVAGFVDVAAPLLGSRDALPDETPRLVSLRAMLAASSVGACLLLAILWHALGAPGVVDDARAQPGSAASSGSRETPVRAPTPGSDAGEGREGATGGRAEEAKLPRERGS